MEKRKITSQKISRSTAGFASVSIALLLSSACVIPADDTPQNNEEIKPTPQSSKPSSPEEKGGEKEVIASSIVSSTEIGSDLQIDIYSLENVGNSLLRLRFGVKNKSKEDYHLYDGLGGAKNSYTAANVSLLDPEGRNRHLSYSQSNDSCFCSRLKGPIKSGQTEEMWVIFPAPQNGIKSMTVTTPLTPPFFNIPITESSEIIENSGLADPQILPLTNISEDTEDQTGRTESGEEISILLSSDVLFETSSADLSPEAQEILEQVAKEVDAASSELVSIEGHADSTGSDSINDPLSQERAEAVESKLESLITRQGVDFDVQGYGSSKPIATNNTEEGRERNRRVSVTFEK